MADYSPTGADYSPTRRRCTTAGSPAGSSCHHQLASYKRPHPPPRQPLKTRSMDVDDPPPEVDQPATSVDQPRTPSRLHRPQPTPPPRQ
eukprot:jgi/Tetstr1/443523/TSEL_031527.t1